MAEVAAGLEPGGRSDLLDEFWLASHGQPVDERMRHAVLFARWRLQEPYSWAQAVSESLSGLSDATNGETQASREAER